MIQSHASTSGKSADKYQSEIFFRLIHKCPANLVAQIVRDRVCKTRRNQARKSKKIPKLQIGARLDEALWWKSNEMIIIIT